MIDESDDFLSTSLEKEGAKHLFATHEIPTLQQFPTPEAIVWRGALSFLNATTLDSELARQGPIFVDRSRFHIGRSTSSHLQLHAADVSREHACIWSSQGVFYLEDLGSSYGTYLNEERILASRLADGDRIRFGGGTSFHFERRVFHSPTAIEDSNDVLLALSHRPEDRMSLTFWGCRGSMPSSGPDIEVFGGNTTCVEVRYRDGIYIIDAGSGIAKLSRNLASEFRLKPLDLQLLFTHLHWDHIQGFPFFSQAYLPETRLKIYEVHSQSGTIRETLRKQMQGEFFPIPMEAMKAKMEFRMLESSPDVNGLRIRRYPLPHPGGAFAFRFETPEESFVFASDCELEMAATNREAYRSGSDVHLEFPAELLSFFMDANLLIIDCQYTDELYPQRIGWGHNSVSTVAEFSSQVRPGRIVLTHHDPDSNDQTVRKIVKSVERLLRQRMGESAPQVSAAREELCLPVTARPTPVRKM